jgi:mono/diheme cytochrome c family protein
MRLRTATVVLAAIVGVSWSSPADARQTPTFTKDVAPILYKNCSQCHRPNEVAPMPLMTYEQVRPWARSIKSKVLKKEMPPWGIGESTLKFSNDRQMSEKEIFTLVAWVDAGAPKGNDADLPAPPSYPGGWKFNREPDVVLKMPVEFTIEPRSEYPMLDFYVPVPWTDGMKLIQMSEARPSNKAVVHHITVSLVTFPPGTEVIDGQPYSTDASGKRVPLDRRTARITEQRLPSDLQIPREPGEKPDRLSSVGGFTTLLAYVAGRGFDDHPDGVGTPALPGQYLNFNMHYTPTGRVETDRSEVGFWFAREPLKKFHFRTPINERQHVNGKLVRGAVPDAADVEAGRASQGATPTNISSFSGLPPIPPFVADYTVTSELAITQDITINGFYPHMHVRGKSAEYKVVYPDGKEQLLFDVPHYRFDWQERYVLAEPLKIPKGSMLKYRAVFDNSANNPLNPNPDKEVYWSEQSWDEMSLGWIEYTLDKQRLPSRTERREQ